MSVEALYQDENCLPEPLQPHHFREGLLYTMTKHANRRNSILVLIIEAKEDTFACNCYFQQTSSANTSHQTGKVTECSYDDIWRLAPRRELIHPHQPDNSSPGQMHRFFMEWIVIQRQLPSFEDCQSALKAKWFVGTTEG